MTIKFMLRNFVDIYSRVITRVVLIPFVSGNSDEMLPSERDRADSNLQHAMIKANQGAGFMIALGKVLIIAQ